MAARKTPFAHFQRPPQPQPIIVEYEPVDIEIIRRESQSPPPPQRARLIDTPPQEDEEASQDNSQPLFSQPKVTMCDVSTQVAFPKYAPRG